jgi:carbon monoxide dehydrogenase subunit G
MEFENSFDVAAPIEEVWATLLDVERVAPCVPGAEVLERVSDDAFKVAIKVRVGPMSMQYRGDIEIVDSDPATHVANMRAKARESRGQGNADADVRMQLTEEGGRTRGTIHTNVQLSGRVAAMGRGIIADVSGKIVEQFSENLAQMLGTDQAAGTPEPAAAAEPAAGAAPTAAAAATPPPTAATSPPPPPRESAGAELSALDLAGAVVKGRLEDPRNVAGLVALVALLAFLLGRRGR